MRRLHSTGKPGGPLLLAAWLTSCGGIAVDSPLNDETGPVQLPEGAGGNGGNPGKTPQPIGAGGTGGGDPGTGGSTPSVNLPFSAEGILEFSYLQWLPTWSDEDGDELVTVGMGRNDEENGAVVSRGSGGQRDWFSFVSEASSAGGGALDPSGDIYMVGITFMEFVAGEVGGSSDAIVARFNGATGERVWGTQWGGTGIDRGKSAQIAKPGTLLVAGETEGFPAGIASNGHWDVFLRAVDSTNGKVQWTQQYGTSAQDEVRELLVDDRGNAYIAGTTLGSFDGQQVQGKEGYVLKVSASTGELHAAQVIAGSGDDEVRRLVLDDSGVLWAAGTSTSQLASDKHQGGEDIFVARLDSETLSVLELHQFGTQADDRLVALERGANGQLYASGFTSGVWPGQKSAGGEDGFVAEISEDGRTLLWVRQFGSSEDDRLSTMLASSNGDLLLMGVTWLARDWTSYFLRLATP